MKKIFIAWVCILVTALLLPACGTSSVDPDCTLEEVFCVGLVTDGGKINDHSLNQAAWEGAQKAQTELGVIANYIETQDWKDYYKNISAFGDVGYDVIIVVGADLTDASIAAAKQYPDLIFLGVDLPESLDKPNNLVVLAFPTDQAGFLAGALAALMTKTNKIGGVFASDDIPHVWRLGEGYKAGAKYINPELQVSAVYHSDVSTEETSSDDPEWGATQASALVENGADIIFAGGDEIGNAALVSAVKGGALAIGFNADQFFTLPEAQKGMLTSIVKNITPIVFFSIKYLKDRKIREDIAGLAGHEYLKDLGYGEEFLNWVASNGNGTVEYAPFHKLKGQVSDEVKARMDKVQVGLADRTITTGVGLEKPGPVPAPTEQPAATPTKAP